MFSNWSLCSSCQLIDRCLTSKNQFQSSRIYYFMIRYFYSNQQYSQTYFTNLISYILAIKQIHILIYKWYKNHLFGGIIHINHLLWYKSHLWSCNRIYLCNSFYIFHSFPRIVLQLFQNLFYILCMYLNFDR